MRNKTSPRHLPSFRRRPESTPAPHALLVRRVEMLRRRCLTTAVVPAETCVDPALQRDDVSRGIRRADSRRGHDERQRSPLGHAARPAAATLPSFAARRLRLTTRQEPRYEMAEAAHSHSEKIGNSHPERNCPSRSKGQRRRRKKTEHLTHSPLATAVLS